MTKTTKNAKHMRQNANLTSAQKRRTRVVALALAGVLAIGGVGAVCIAGAAKSPGQAPVVAVQQQQGNGQIQKAVVRKDSSQTNAKPTAKQAAKQTAQQSTSQAQKPATKQTAKQAVSQAQKPVAKQTAKPVAKQVAQKNTSQAQKNVAKPAVQQTAQQAASQPAKPTVRQAAQQGASQVVKPAVQQTAQQGGSGSGLEAKISREQCISTACAHVGAGGQAKGEARNVTARQVTGGGTVYYVVELDLGEVHYVVNVDAIDGGVIGSDCTHAGKRVLLDKNGDPIEGTEQPVEDTKAVAKMSEQGGGSGSGLEAKISREQCISTACAHVGAGGQAKGEARNVTARQVTGGGTVYYVVELDLGEVHYVVNVDAIDGGVIGSDCTHAGKRVLLDKNGDPIKGTEQPVDA